MTSLPVNRHCQLAHNLCLVVVQLHAKFGGDRLSWQISGPIQCSLRPMTSLPIYRHHCRLAHNCRLAVIYLHAKFGGDWSPRLDSKPHSVFSGSMTSLPVYQSHFGQPITANRQSSTSTPNLMVIGSPLWIPGPILCFTSYSVTSTSKPNCVLIGPTVWMSIREQTNPQTHISTNKHSLILKISEHYKNKIDLNKT